MNVFLAESWVAANAAEWATAIVSTVGLAGLYLLWGQLKLLRTQIVDDHQRSRQERAVELIRHWSTSMKQESSAARKLVEALPDDQVKAIWNENEVRIDAQYKDRIESCLGALALPTTSVKSVDERILLSAKEASKIRWLVLTYVNTLESVLSAWRHGVADKKIIEEEFAYLYDEKAAHYGVEKFRAIAGRENFPAINEFIAYLKNKKQSTPDPLPPLGRH